jgi:hypothetical protein
MVLKAWAERKLQGLEARIGAYPPLSLREPVVGFGGDELRRFQFLNALPALGLWLIPLILVPWADKGRKRTNANRNFGTAPFMSLGLIGMAHNCYYNIVGD